MIFLICLNPTGTITSQAPPEAIQIPNPWFLAAHGSRGHESDFSTLLDGLEEHFGIWVCPQA